MPATFQGCEAGAVRRGRLTDQVTESGLEGRKRRVTDVHRDWVTECSVPDLLDRSEYPEPLPRRSRSCRVPARTDGRATATPGRPRRRCRRSEHRRRDDRGDGERARTSMVRPVGIRAGLGCSARAQVAAASARNIASA